MAISTLPGQEIVPGFTLVRQLGSGMAGDVWVARASGGVEIAIKIIRDLEMLGSQRELGALRVVREVKHPNLCPLFGVWFFDRDGNRLDLSQTDAVLFSDPNVDGSDDLGASAEIDMHGTMAAQPQFLETPAAEAPIAKSPVSESPMNRPVPSVMVVAMGLGEQTLFDRLVQAREEKGLTASIDNGTDDDLHIVGGIDVDELLRYLSASASAIDELNTRYNIFHCDIKPQNILIVGGQAQVCDFGLARQVKNTRQTQMAFASPAYGAPEMLFERTYSKAIDQYSLAMTYYELRTGKLPYEKMTQLSILTAKSTGQLDLSLVTPAEQKVLSIATNIDPEKRYKDCQTFVAALADAVHPPVFERAQSSRPLIIVAFVVAVSVVALTAGYLWEKKHQSPKVVVEPKEQDVKPEVVQGDATTTQPETKVVVQEPEMVDEVKPPQVPVGRGTKELPWIVASDGTGTHSSIVEAMNANRPDADFDAIYINVRPGIYEETVSVDAAVSLKGLGEKPEDTMIRCSTRSPLVIDCGANVCRLENLYIYGRGHKVTETFNAIDLTSGTLEVLDCAIESDSYNGIKARAGSQLTAIGCDFVHSKEFAISSKQAKQLLVNECTFRKSGVQWVGGMGSVHRSFFYGSAGIYVEDTTLGKTVMVQDCLFDECDEYGLASVVGANVEVHQSQFTSCRVGIKCGVAKQDMESQSITSESLSSVVVDQCNFVKCAEAAAIISGAGKATFQNECSVVGGRYAILVDAGTVLLENCRIQDTQSHSVLAIEKAKIQLSKTTISNSGGSAVKMDSGDLQVSDGSIEQAAENGIEMQLGTLTMTGGSIDRCNEAGVFLDLGCQNASLTNVLLLNNQQAAIMVADGPLLVDKCRVVGGQVGLFAGTKQGSDFTDADWSVEVSETEFSELKQFAIVAYNAFKVRVRDCSFEGIDPSKQALQSNQAEILTQ